MEIDYQKLKELGITNNGKKKQFCPECHANRTDKRDKSLMPNSFNFFLSISMIT